MAKKPSRDFEQSLSALEAIVEKMEQGNLSLEDSLKAFEQGVELTRECQLALENAEQKVKILTTNEQGQDVLEDFDAQGAGQGN